jgi:hypothetical protein
MKIGKTPKKLDSNCCPQSRETKADTLKATEGNKRRGPGTREKVRSRRINLEGNTHAQEINVSQLLYSYPYLNYKSPCSFLLLLILSLQKN